MVLKQAVDGLSKRGIGCWWLIGVGLLFFVCHFSYYFLVLVLGASMFQYIGSFLTVASIPISVLLGYKLPLMNFTSQSLLKCGCAIFVGIMAAHCARLVVNNSGVLIGKELLGHISLNVGLYALVCFVAFIYHRQSIRLTRSAYLLAKPDWSVGSDEK